MRSAAGPVGSINACAAPPAPACARYLADNAKAATEWRREAAFAGFERRYGGSR